MGNKIKVPINELKTGMNVASDVVTFTGKLLISRGNCLTDKTIALLKAYHVHYVMIELPEKKVTVSKAEEIQESPKFKEFQKDFFDSVQNFKGQLGKITTSTSKIDEPALLSCVGNILDKENNGFMLMNMLENMRQSNDAIYEHCINVALVSHVIANWGGFPKEQIDQLMEAALLHDIGMTMIPEEFYTKEGKLSSGEYAQVKRHTMLGYNILKERNMAEIISKTALLHHERCDGSGYPLGIRNFETNDFAKIVAIADMYAAMTHDRPYRPKVSPFEVVRMLQGEALNKYDAKYLLPFLDNILDTYIHYQVLLSDGKKGEIIFINKSDPLRPIVNIGGRCVDLALNQTVTIEKLL